MTHPNVLEIDAAIETLKKVIDAAENSNHSGEVALMRAIKVIVGSHVAMPMVPRPEIIIDLYGPFLSVTAHDSRIKAYQDMLKNERRREF